MKRTKKNKKRIGDDSSWMFGGENNYNGCLSSQTESHTVSSLSAMLWIMTFVLEVARIEHQTRCENRRATKKLKRRRMRRRFHFEVFFATRFISEYWIHSRWLEHWWMGGNNRPCLKSAEKRPLSRIKTTKKIKLISQNRSKLKFVTHIFWAVACRVANASQSVWMHFYSEHLTVRVCAHSVWFNRHAWPRVNGIIVAKERCRLHELCSYRITPPKINCTETLISSRQICSSYIFYKLIYDLSKKYSRPKSSLTINAKHSVELFSVGWATSNYF